MLFDAVNPFRCGSAQWGGACHDTIGLGETMDITSTYLQKRLGLKRFVRFAGVTLIGTTDTYTEVEKELCFYSKKDRQDFEEDRRNTFRKFREMADRGEPWVETDEMSLRGLEEFFTTLKKEDARRMHVSMILTEQNRQRKLGIYPAHEEFLRQLSSEHSASCKARAVLTAQRDALVSERYLLQPCRTRNNTPSTGK